MDYDEDYDLICSSYFQQYGTHFHDDVNKFSFWYINNLVMNLSEKTRFGNVLKMRRDEIDGFINCDHLKSKPKPDNNNERYKEYRRVAISLRTKRRIEKTKRK